MITTVADRIVQRLSEWGVSLVFGYPGGSVNALVGALSRGDAGPRFIQARHEETAAFEAVGFAKFSDRPGVCLATAGAGAARLLNGLYDAKLDRVPVIAIIGEPDRSTAGYPHQHGMDLSGLLADATAGRVQMVLAPGQALDAIDQAFQTALTQRGPAAVIVPHDVQKMEFRGSGAITPMPARSGAASRHAVPNRGALQAAADTLNAGTKLAILVGRGARGAVEDVREVADLLQAGVAKSPLGKDVLSDELPCVTGTIGPLGTCPSYEMLRDCDTLLTIGSSFSSAQYLPEPGRVRGVRITIDDPMIVPAYLYDIDLVGDVRMTLRALLPLLRRRDDRTWRHELEGKIALWWSMAEGEADLPADPVNPMRVFSDFNAHAPGDAMVLAESGPAANWYARQIRMREGMRGALSGALEAIGSSLPYAIGAKFAYPDRPAVVFVGDAAMQLNGLTELLTIANYYRDWTDPRLVVVVLHTNDPNQVSGELSAIGDASALDGSQCLPELSYADFAESIGLGGVTVADPDDLSDAWQTVLAGDRPHLLDVYCDPDVPPIPPHTTLAQIQDAAASLVMDETSRWIVIKRAIKIKEREGLLDHLSRRPVVGRQGGPPAVRASPD